MSWSSVTSTLRGYIARVIVSWTLIVHTQAMRHRSIGALLGLRVILVANIILLTVLGVLFLMSYERPVAFVFAGLAWLAALVLVNFVRFTDPYAWPRGNRRGHSARTS